MATASISTIGRAIRARLLEGKMTWKKMMRPAGEKWSPDNQDGYFTALFNNTRTLKLKAQPTNAFFAAVNQMFGGSSQLTTTAELCSLSELCTTI